MNQVVVNHAKIPAMSPTAIGRARQIENILSLLPQEPIDTAHIIHGGMYSRTIKVLAGVMITGAIIKVPTILIINGDATVWIGEKSVKASGYYILPASANRKQAFLADSDVYLTMIFATQAKTVEEAEQEFTDQFQQLLSRSSDNRNFVTITGE